MFYSSLPPSLRSATYQKKLIAYTTTQRLRSRKTYQPSSSPGKPHKLTQGGGKVSLHPDGLSTWRDHQGVKKRVGSVEGNDPPCPPNRTW